MKFPRYKFVLIGLTIAILLWNAFNPKTNSSPFEQNSDPSQVPEYVNTPSTNMVNHMEYIGCDKNESFVSKITFYYYRDVVTDQMFLISYDSKGHTVTPMLDPATGLPLTYSQYQAMRDSNSQTEEDSSLESNS